MQALTQNPPSGRGCGKERDEGGVYACTGVEAFGMPPEYFLLDPVRAFPWQRGVSIMADSLPKTESGNEFIQAMVNATWHLIVFVGLDGGGKGGPGYPSAWSFLEEGREFGYSRKISREIVKSDKFKLLDPEKSRMIVVHPKALPLFDYRLNRPDKPLGRCKQFQDWVEHKNKWTELPSIPGWHPDQMNYLKKIESSYEQATFQSRCALALRDLSYLNHDTNHPMQDGRMNARMFEVDMPSFSYKGYTPLEPLYKDGIDIKWASAAFMSLPLHFEIPHSDKFAVTQGLMETGWQPEIVEW